MTSEEATFAVLQMLESENSPYTAIVIARQKYSTKTASPFHRSKTRFHGNDCQFRSGSFGVDLMPSAEPIVR